MLRFGISVAASLKAASTIGAWLAAATLLAGCGQKGPLALPAPAIAPASAAASAR